MTAQHCDHYIAHYKDSANKFIKHYFGASDRNILLIAGAGFDPRAGVVAKKLAEACRSMRAVLMRAVLLKEQRKGTSSALHARADGNTDEITKVIKDSRIIQVDIFASDGAVVGGRGVVKEVSQLSLYGITDIVVDVSALSIGTIFPVIRYLREKCIQPSDEGANLHIFVTHNPQLDAAVGQESSDKPTYVHGFRGLTSPDASTAATKLWLPQLVQGRVSALNRIYNFVGPDETCPILPFPAHDPRLGDALVEEYLTELESGWSSVRSGDICDIVYADEGDPLDLYRTILDLDEQRKSVFKESGGSRLVLSPTGSKLMAVGALIVAMERDLPIAYLEAEQYTLDELDPAVSTEHSIVHIWLAGSVYGPSRQPGGARSAS